MLSIVLDQPGLKVHKQAPVGSWFASLPSLELFELFLAVLGWLVAFLLGKELASGYVQWRRGHAADEDPRRRP